LNLVLLRVEGDQARLDEIAERLDLHLDQRWTQGEADRRGARFRGSGYSATIADSQTPAEMIKHIREFVMLCRSTSTDFVGLRAELSVGVTVGDETQYAVAFELAPSDLAEIGALGITLAFAAYPSAGEE